MSKISLNMIIFLVPVLLRGRNLYAREPRVPVYHVERLKSIGICNGLGGSGLVWIGTGNLRESDEGHGLRNDSSDNADHYLVSSGYIGSLLPYNWKRPWAITLNAGLSLYSELE